MAESLAPETQLAHYRIVSPLGAGGMGEVYLAEDNRLGRRVALKILPVEFTKHPERVARFEQEARAASALNHPNIITVYDIGRHAGRHFIAFEYVAGVTLRQHLTGQMTLGEALDIAIQTAAALQAAHEAGITHRDIKPENVMLRPDGYVKVLDFGLAKLTEKSEGKFDPEAATKLKAHTDPGMVMGTVRYMSPEQARGQRVDARSDIFSLGVLLYEMIARRLPFDGATASDVIAAILREEPEPLANVVTNLPAELGWSVAKALRKNCEERYQTIKSLGTDLRQIKTRLDVEAALANLSSSDIAARTTGSSSLSEAVTVEFNSAAAKSATTRRPRKSKTPKIIDSLAILPLINVSKDSQMEYLSDGITESIINSLAQLPKLRVVPASTVQRYKGRVVDPQLAGRELKVRAVLTGRVQLVANALIVKTELIDVANNAQLWGEQYRRQMTDIFALQDEISQEISAQLRLQLTREEKKRLVKRYTDNTEAYHLYLKGRYYNSKRTPEWIRKGIEHFQQAIDLDPNYALAYAGMADSYGFLASSTGNLPPREAYPKAKAAALKALELDEALGEAHCSLGFFHLLYDWDFAAAEQQYKRAIELSPNYPNAHDGYGFYLKATGQHEAALHECKLAQQLDPLSLFSTLSVGWAYYFARRFDHGLAQGRKVLELDPNFGFAYAHAGLCHLQLGQFDEAVASMRKAVNLAGGSPNFLAYLGHALGRAGQHREARQMLAQLERLRKRQYVSAYFSAMIYLGLGNRHEALTWLEEAYEERSGFLAFVKVEPMLDVVRGEERFANLLALIH
ncbi:MAG: protein kinase [Acidobacteria bacterium]|nr:protein kinase [Acidobacteriota bacterium]MBI3426008.1 protein kinase [Acidobacteriota bacterium]